MSKTEAVGSKVPDGAQTGWGRCDWEEFTRYYYSHFLHIISLLIWPVAASAW